VGARAASRAVEDRLVARSTERKEDLEALHELLEAGKVTPVVERTFPLSEVPKAIRYLSDEHSHGKVTARNALVPRASFPPILARAAVTAKVV
jgi:NADPH:quinone reductase-like Zn-dependent oxidoreductase